MKAKSLKGKAMKRGISAAMRGVSPLPDARALLFKVIVRKHEYKIFASGEIEGFPTGAITANYLPSLLSQEVAEYRRKTSSEIAELTHTLEALHRTLHKIEAELMEINRGKSFRMRFGLDEPYLPEYHPPPKEPRPFPPRPRYPMRQVRG